MPDGTGDSDSDAQHSVLALVIEELAPLLPAQGPISIFIHHNTLHASEDLPFEEAVERAAERLGWQPYLSEARYRAKVASGRILARDVESILAEDLAARSEDAIAEALTRLDLWRRIVLHGIPSATGRVLSWLIEETPALSRFRTDLPGDARSAAAALADTGDDQGGEANAGRHLWDACLGAI